MAKKLKTVGEKAEDISVTDDAVEPTLVEADSLVDPLLMEQKAQANQMRSALLTCRTSDISSAKVALQNIAVLQIYHQVGRIIRFTEQMDLLEDKLYSAINANMSAMDDFDPNTMILLLKVQGDLYKAMVLSQDLLKPYMDIDLAAIAPPKDITEENSFGASILPKESRTVIRNGAQALLTELRNQAEKPSQNDDGTDNEARTE